MEDQVVKRWAQPLHMRRRLVVPAMPSLVLSTRVELEHFGQRTVCVIIPIPLLLTSPHKSASLVQTIPANRGGSPIAVHEN